MDDRISDLLGIVRDEIQLYCDLVEHAREKTSLLVEGRVDAILESNKIDETLALRLRAMEMKRLRLCDDLMVAFGIPREEFTLSKLAERLEHSHALEIRTQVKHFKNVAKQLKHAGTRNRKLIEQALNYSKGMIAVIANASGAYQPSGVFEKIPAMQPTFSQRA
jgi:hypothetical protein